MSSELIKSLPYLLKKGLVIYESLKEDMQKALGFKEYAEQLSHITLTLRSVNRHLNDEERAIMDKLDKAYELSQNGLEKATIVVTVIKEQCSSLANLLSESVPGENNYKLFSACQYFSKFAKQMEAKVKEAQDRLREASDALFASLDDIRSIINTLRRVQNGFLQAKRAAESHARSVAYGGALAGLIAGPVGLIISYAIATGVTEGVTIPQIEANFAQQLNTMSGYISSFEKMHTETEELQEVLDTKRQQLVEIYDKLSAAGKLAGTASNTLDDVPLEEHFTAIRQSVESIVKKCEEFLGTLRS